MSYGRCRKCLWWFLFFFCGASCQDARFLKGLDLLFDELASHDRFLSELPAQVLCRLVIVSLSSGLLPTKLIEVICIKHTNTLVWQTTEKDLPFLLLRLCLAHRLAVKGGGHFEKLAQSTLVAIKVRAREEGGVGEWSSKTNSTYFFFD